MTLNERKLILEGPIFHWTMIVGGRLTTKLFESPITLPNTSRLKVCPTGSIPSSIFRCDFEAFCGRGNTGTSPNHFSPLFFNRGSKMMVAYLYRHLVTGISEKTPTCSTKKKLLARWYPEKIHDFCTNSLHFLFFRIGFLLLRPILFAGVHAIASWHLASF